MRRAFFFSLLGLVGVVAMTALADERRSITRSDSGAPVFAPLAQITPARGEDYPPFRGRARLIDPETRRHMRGASWRPGCPVGLGDLRLLRLGYVGFDGAARRGRLVVHEDAVDAVLHAMRALYEQRFPIRRMKLVDAYGADDDRSMAADNTSAFNCRRVAGSTRWSQHAYGRAIDINPVENPWVSGERVSPPAGERFADRSQRAPGMIHAGGPVVRAFREVGWGWGGSWSAAKDYQHFSSTGR